MSNKTEKSGVEFVWTARRARLDPKNYGVNPDQTKDRRWVAIKRVSERKFKDGFSLVSPDKIASDPKLKEFIDTSGGAIRYDNMVLMERPREIAEQSKREKEARTRQRTQAAKDSFRNEVEKLSSKHGMDLHKFVEKMEGDD